MISETNRGFECIVTPRVNNILDQSKAVGCKPADSWQTKLIHLENCDWLSGVPFLESVLKLKSLDSQSIDMLTDRAWRPC